MSSLYSPLNPARKEIRIATLQPGKWDDEIKCSLQVVSLNDNPAYSALSYVWGRADQTVDISVDDRPFPVRLNLEKALRRIRSESQSLVLWIDSISINQHDINERSEQVQIMGAIYKSTRDCIMWLGDVEDEPIEPYQPLQTWDLTEVTALERRIRDSKLASPAPLQRAGKETGSIDVPGAFEVVKLLAQRGSFYKMPFFRVLPTGKFELCPVWSKAVYSLENILRRTWWTRIWTAQEAFLPERATVRVGDHELPYTFFLDAASSWAYHIRSYSRNRWDNCCESFLGLWKGYTSTRTSKALFGGIEDLKVLRDARLNRERDARLNRESISVAHDLFLLTIQRAATVQHDHIYGLYGLISEFYDLDETPDYSLDLARLYTSITIKFMEKTKHLCLVPYARPLKRVKVATEKEKQYRDELPTWCPDWHPSAWKDDKDYFDIYNYGGFTADKSQPYHGERLDDAVLKLQGILVTTISTVGPSIGSLEVAPGEFVPAIQTWLDLAKSKGLSPEAVWETIHVATHKDVGVEIVGKQAAWWNMLKYLASNGATFEDMRHAAEKDGFKHHQMSMEFLNKRAVFTVGPGSSTSLNERNSDEISKYETTLPQGSIGMSRRGVREGDCIFVVKGGRTPLIFRPLADEPLRSKARNHGIPEGELHKCFTFVGVCYIYEMMEGQALADSPSYEHIYLL